MKDITLKTPIKHFERAEIIRMSRIALNWCKREFGMNNRKKYELTYSFAKGDKNECGHYDAEENEIGIYWNQISNIKELIGTCIHEWTHYKQPILAHYYKHKSIEYKNNPYEIAARKAERKFYKVCWESIQHKINRS